MPQRRSRCAREDAARGRAVLRRGLAAFTAVIVVACAPRLALALGVIVAAQGDGHVVASRTLLAKIASDRTLQMTEIRFDLTTTSDFLWVLPIPADTEAGEIEVVGCVADAFDELANASAPRVLLRSRQSGDCGAREIPEPVQADIGAVAYIDDEYEPTETPAQHAPFASNEEFEAWLAEIGSGQYAIERTSFTWPFVSNYVGNTYAFVAAEVEPSFSTGRVCIGIEYTPYTDRDVAYQIATKSLSFSTEEHIELLVYVLDDGASVPYVIPETGETMYRATTINPDSITVDATGHANYADVFALTIGEAPAPPVFVIESAGALADPPGWAGSSSTFLTRLRTSAAPSQLNGSDLALQVNPIESSEVVPRDYSIIVAQAGAGPDASLLLCATALACTLALRRRRRGER
jgi:hypothetical protein